MGPALKKRRDQRGPIFLDVAHRRLKWARGIVIFGFAFLLAWISSFSIGIYNVGKISGPEVLQAAAKMRNDGGVPLETSTPQLVPAADNTTQTCGTGPDFAVTQSQFLSKTYAFLPSQSDWPGLPAGTGCAAIDVVLADWYALDMATGVISAQGTDTGDRAAVLARLGESAGRATVLPVLTLSPPLTTPASQAPSETTDAVAQRVAALVADNGFAGLCLDIGDPVFGALFAEVGRRLSAMGRQTCLITSAQSPLWRDAAVLKAADLVVLRAFIEAAPGMGSAPLAEQEWFERNIAEAVATIGADRLVVAMGSFGQDWIVGQPASERIGYGEAMRRAARPRGRIEFSPDALNTTVHWADDQGRQHVIWLLDAVSLRNQRKALTRYPLAGVAIWPLGLEDPGSWAAMALASPKAMEAVTLRDYVGYDGQGPFMRVTQTEVDGHRTLALDPASGLIRQQSYSEIPQPFSMRRFGAGTNDMVVLTFDDGPDATYTPQILNILRAKAVPAAFFVIGSSLLESPDIVRRMVADGHEVGSHTFFHPDIERISGFRMMLELNALQRLLGSVTGHGTVLFRTPYGRGNGPLTATEARPFLALDQGGYVVVGSNVVPPDWQNAAPEQIVASVMAQLAPTGGNVIVLHDGGGDRSSTVAALPLLIEELRAKGHRFVSLATLLGVGPQALMPVEQGARVTFDGLTFGVIGSLGSILSGIFWIAIVLGLVRALLMLGLSLIRRRRPVNGAAFTPPVTIVIPAYDEDDVIVACIRSVMASDYPDWRLIIVDDGSHDHTYKRAAEICRTDRRLTLLHEENQGKWMALDLAIPLIDTEIMVALDADTLLQRDAIRKLVQPFHDGRVGAVAGRVQVGNPPNLLTRLQALEYAVTQNIDRRAAEVFNGIMVVPGAIGAWRTAAVRKAGLYSGETLAEDADLTVSILRAGYRVVYEPDAISITEAPDTLRGFMKQRLRWTFGMMQTAWKHRHATREGRAVGLFSIPDLWLFGVFLALLAPIADLMFFRAALDVLMDAALGRPILQTPGSLPILAGYLALPMIDVITAFVAFGFERRPPWLVLLIPVQRLFYRPLLYITVYRATWRAITGRFVAWGKLVRLGTVGVADT